MTLREALLEPSIDRQAGRKTDDEAPYIALIHKDSDSSYGVSFPDVPGVITAGETLEEALVQAASVLEFAFEDWAGPLPTPRTIDELREDPEFLADSADAVLVAVRPETLVVEAAQ